MKKGQTSKREGIQDILFPMEYMNITQGNNGQYSHQGANALDLAGKDTGRDLFYAPFDVRCVATGDRNTEGNAAFWQSVNQVRYADGTVDYATIMVLHDNSLNGIYPGATYKQGAQIGQEGTAEIIITLKLQKANLHINMTLINLVFIICQEALARIKHVLLMALLS